MNYRKIWTEADFADMGWHDAVLYSMNFPQASCAIRFDIDYISNGIGNAGRCADGTLPPVRWNSTTSAI